MGRADAALKPDRPQKYKQPKGLTAKALGFMISPVRDNAAVQE
jgi:hypothetical protein